MIPILKSNGLIAKLTIAWLTLKRPQGAHNIVVHRNTGRDELVLFRIDD